MNCSGDLSGDLAILELFLFLELDCLGKLDKGSVGDEVACLMVEGCCLCQGGERGDSHWYS